MSYVFAPDRVFPFTKINHAVFAWRLLRVHEHGIRVDFRKQKSVVCPHKVIKLGTTEAINYDEGK